MKPPATDAGYTPKHAKHLDDTLATASPRDYRSLSAEVRMPAILALVSVIESGIKVLHRRIEGDSEPFPGAALGVAKQTLQAIDLARKSGLLS